MVDRAIETYSLSKAYSVPGWRVGAILGSEAAIRRISHLKSYVDYGIFLPIQLASAAVLGSKEDLVKSAVQHYSSRSRVLVQGLRRLGWEVESPRAGACVWAHLPERFQKKGAIAFAEDLLEKSSVVVMPGELFGAEHSSQIRFAMVASESVMQEVLKKLETFAEGRI